MTLRSILLASALLAATPAQAATYIITYQGTVYGSYGSSLDGLGFTAVYTLTDPLPGAILYGDGSTYAATYGGSYYSAPSPVSATLTINGITRAFSGDEQNYAEQYNDYGGSFDEVRHYSGDIKVINGSYVSNYIQNYISSYSNDFLSSIDYTSPLSYTVQAGDTGYGYFRFYAPDGGYANGYLNSTSVTIAALAGGVPEPATWALMILGFGLVGGVLRRQRRRIAVQFS
jgi:hypothetical protein